MFNFGKGIFDAIKTPPNTSDPTRDLPNVYVSSEDMRKQNKKAEKFVEGINPDWGEKLSKYNEKVENLAQTAENFEDANNPSSIFNRALSSKENHFNLGDHLYVQRFGYTHHGLYVGDDCVIHYLMDEGIIKYSLEEFARGAKIHIKGSYTERSNGEIVARAYSRLGEGTYNLFQNNCEHFVTWCRSGR
ncbi:lecithin retinol acyltransferase family protein [Bacillus sp. FJAT-29937]|uniref:lecithin retinol acyltransferase family protein n=1 Tax=Bacillus sp. FJAT-29937 TaxID=1720553 RepID=UPI0009EAD20C|nr:lecithin retinol acyltransferase family protein [Bacillus sp. FJAT-29937]